MDIKSKEIRIVPVDSIITNPDNANQHPQDQIERLCKLIKYQGFRNPVIVSNRTGFLVAGHGRLEAAKKLGIKEIPAIYQDFENEAQEYAYVISDNEISRWAELDFEKVENKVKELEGFDLELLGLKEFEVRAEDSEDVYTRKIESPIYEPSGEKPLLESLLDDAYCKSLIEEINGASISDEEKAFLRLAAHRHVKFNYSKIANFYAHSSDEVKRLMQNSALVIIDFNKAIELGFVKLSEDLLDIVSKENEG